MAESRGIEPHPFIREPSFQGSSQDRSRCITFQSGSGGRNQTYASGFRVLRPIIRHTPQHCTTI